MDEIKQLRRVGERIADALEKLVQSATDDPITVEFNPPQCPHCGEIDPVTEMPESEASTGPLSQVIISGKCMSCGNSFFTVIESFSNHKSIETVIQEIRERSEGGDFK